MKMNREQMLTYLKATLPLTKDPDIDTVINAALVLAIYYDHIIHRKDLSDDEIKNAIAMVVGAFDRETVHYLEETIEDFKEEVLMMINEMSYDDIIKDYKDTLRSLIDDFSEAIEIREGGEQNSMYFTSHELQFIKYLLEKKEDELDGRC